MAKHEWAEELATTHRFGGAWTVDKLQALREYLAFYTTALKGQPSPNEPFKLVYIDSFAGTGRCHVRAGSDDEQVIDGSAKIALDCSPGFQAYHFIEPKKSHAEELQRLLDGHPNGPRAHLERKRAADVLPSLLRRIDWKSTRGVLFLDPYGLQCTWDLVEQVARTRALDVFFLVSLSGLFRQAALSERKIDESKRAALTRFLGTEDWKTALYTREQQDLFDEPSISRDPGYKGMLQFTTQRLQSVFPYVSDPQLLGGKRSPAMFALYFAAANPGARALKLAARVSRDILCKLSRPSG